MAAESGRYCTIEKSPSDELSLKNRAVVREGDELARGGTDEKPVYVKVVKLGRPYYLTLATHKGISAGSLGLSGVQRDWCTVRLKETVQVQPFPIDRNSHLIGGIVVEVDFYAKPKTLPPALNTDTLAPLFRERLVNNVFVVGQQMVLGGWDELPQLKKTPLKATILQITAEDYSQLVGKGGSTSKKTEYGILHQNSRVIFERKKESSIQLTGRAVGDSAHVSIISPDWDFKEMEIGGLDKEFSDIFRRAFASRVFPPDVVEELGMKHVRGILLFGPPGTGKTLMARQIGKMLNAKPPKIINGPEVLNKFVGESESNIRQLFAEAEDEQKKMGINSALHIIIFDELDAICKQRGSVGGGTGVHDTVVNQLLAKIDGVEQLNNILLIGMTNRIDLIDDALLRPGRLEVQMEIGLPDEAGRLEILQIHTAHMRAHGKLDKVDLNYLASKTRNFSGAEIEGLVRSAQATAMNKIIKAKAKVVVGREEAEQLKITMEDFNHALQYDVKPAFGISDEQLDRYVFNGIIPWSPRILDISDIGSTAIKQIRTSVRTPLVTLLLRGDAGCGKTALAASLAKGSEFPFIKVLTPENMVGYSEGAKCQAIKKVFDDAYKSELSCVVVDDIERLFDYVPIGPRFSNLVLQALLVLLRKLPPVTGKTPHKLLVIGTTRFKTDELNDTGLAGAFDTVVDVPNLRQGSEVMAVLKEPGLYSFQKNQIESLQKGLGSKRLKVGIKKLLALVEASLQAEDPVKTLLLRLQLEAHLGTKEDSDTLYSFR